CTLGSTHPPICDARSGAGSVGDPPFEWKLVEGMIGLAVAPTAPGLRGWLIWLIVAGIAGAVSAAKVVEETRTTSLLLSRWAAFLASLVILLDMAAAGLVAAVVHLHPPAGQIPQLFAYIGVAAIAPAILHSLQV